MRALFLLFGRITILSFALLVSPAIAEVTLDQLYERAYAAQSSGNYAEEEATWREIAQRDPLNRVSVYSNLGLALLPQGKSDEAVTVCRQALAIDPNYGLALLCLRSGLISQQRYVEAERIWRDMIQENPENARVYYVDLGYILREQGRLDESIDICQQAFQLAPQDDGAFLCVTYGLIQQDKISDAISWAEQAIQAAPSNESVYTTQLYVFLGNQLRSAGYIEEAASVYREAIQLDPDNPQPLEHLADLLMEQSNQ